MKKEGRNQKCVCCGGKHGIKCEICGKVGCYNVCPYRVGLGSPYPCRRIQVHGTWRVKNDK